MTTPFSQLHLDHATPIDILLLSGRAPACLEWVRLLASLSGDNQLNKPIYRVHVADSVSPSLSQFSNKLTSYHYLSAPSVNLTAWTDDLVKIVHQHDIKLIIPTCEEVFYLASACRTHQLLRDRAWTANFDTLMNLHHKFDFYQLVNRLNSPIKAPTSHLIPRNITPTRLYKLLTKLYPKLSSLNHSTINSLNIDSVPINQILHTTCDWVIKPCLSRFATRTLMRPTLAELLTALYNINETNSRNSQNPQSLLLQLMKAGSITDTYCNHDSEAHETIEKAVAIPNLKINISRKTSANATSSRFSEFDKDRLSFRKVINAKNGVETLANSWIVQAYIEGEEFASYSLTHQGHLLAHTCYEANCRTQTNDGNPIKSIDNNQSFSPQKTGASLDFNAIDEPNVVEFVRAVINQISSIQISSSQYMLSGQLGFDFIKDTHGTIWVLECNPRATSGIHLLAHDPNFINFANLLTQKFMRTATHPLLNDLALNDIQPYIQTTSTHLALKFAIVYELLKSPKDWSLKMQTLMISHDVIYDKDDMHPVYGQIIASTDLLWRAWRQQKNILAMSTDDIAWDEEMEETRIDLEDID